VGHVTSTAWRPAPASATGVGSLPGVEPREAAATVVGELPDLPHLPELPGRGPGADMLGRAGALLLDLHVDLQPSGWRLVDRAGMDERRARSYLGQDLDELESHADGFVGPVKLQVCGPWTTAASLQLPRGEPVLKDAGAVRDLVASLTEGLIAHVADLRARLPGAEPVLQLDEPSLPAVLAGAIRSSSGATTVHPVKETDAEDVLAALVAAVGVPVVVHCCAARPPVDLARRAGAAGVSVDLTLLGQDMDDELGEAVESGLVLLAGLVPSTGTDPDAVSGVTATVEPVRRLWRRLGLAQAKLSEQVVVTPTCGLAGASPAYARAALVRAREAARALMDMEV
jgi:hypothetical protein